MADKIQITTFYKFIPHSTEEVQILKGGLESFSKKLRGLVIIGTEGFNGTVSGEEQSLSELKTWLMEYVSSKGVGKLQFKDSFCDYHPFRLLKVKVRKEIVTLGDEKVIPEINTDASHLSPEAWDAMLEREDTVCIDTRNWYETEVGKFKAAVDPKIDEFQEFPEFLEKSGISKDKKLLMYCTGGIRCEKAVIDARKQGYEEVYQLEGGILNYFQERGGSQYEGECFVFDNRVAVDSELNPTQKFTLCPHCGQPAQVPITCAWCGTEAIVCQTCLDDRVEAKTCSKNCAHQHKLHPHKTGKRQGQGFQAEMQAKKQG